MSIAASSSVTFTKVPTSAAIPGEWKRTRMPRGTDAAADATGGESGPNGRITSTVEYTGRNGNAFSPTGTTFGRPSGGGSGSRTISLM